MTEIPDDAEFKCPKCRDWLRDCQCWMDEEDEEDDDD